MEKIQAKSSDTIYGTDKKEMWNRVKKSNKSKEEKQVIPKWVYL
jgi:hypothetical protein